MKKSIVCITALVCFSFLSFRNEKNEQHTSKPPSKLLAGGSLIVESITGKVTENETYAFKRYMLERVPAPDYQGGNTWVFGNQGKAIEACGLMFDATHDVAILDRMIYYCDAALSDRNDLAPAEKGGQRIAWTGNIEPIWPSTSFSVSPEGAGVEQGDVVAHMVYCSKLILQTPAIWDTKVAIGDPHQFGATYKERALKYITEGDYVIDKWILPRFVRTSDHNLYYFPGSPNTYKPNDPAPWNQAWMVTNALVRLVECHVLLNDAPDRITKYDAIIKPNIQWFLDNARRTISAAGTECRTWAYAYPKGMEDTNHFAYDAEGLWIAYDSGRYIQAKDVLPFANTYMDVVLGTGSNGVFAGRVDGSTGTGHGGGDAYVRDEYIYLTELRPDKYEQVANIEISKNKVASSPQITARLLWEKNRRFLKGQ
jgi:hypothetical protein